MTNEPNAIDSGVANGATGFPALSKWSATLAAIAPYLLQLSFALGAIFCFFANLEVKSGTIVSKVSATAGLLARPSKAP